MHVKDPNGLSLLYHLNSEPWLDEEAYRGSPYVQEFINPDPSAAYLPLPASQPSSLTSLIRNRRSVRAYRPAQLAIASLSRLLSDCYGATNVEQLSGGGSFLRRSVPSAGGLYPLEMYVLAHEVEGLEDGIYHYDARGHGLAALQTQASHAALEPIFLTYPFISHANLIVCIVAEFLRTQKKYGPRGYRYMLLEAGHAAQNLCLSATEQGLGSLCMGGFFDSPLNAFLELPPLEQAVLYAVSVGHPA
jgi:SagB-type dehydrogenase family enzyme